ncbi:MULTISPECIES: hypothetical protein [Bacillaceae]|uniref:hypothetical protein n=1 Tax=Bacillaceae TaxID=186817 RepID=UPI001E43CD90|nr:MULTISPECIES: hypothetical protein [Bacillaceae]MCE4047261.1 hypothetical protein [Bacillus sp. Au-Bac7]MCM3031416.1 hypothetical protein [Niallia sp. MER 6]MDL0435799.1 hypothetical protein [Niallia sp. SS-2023]UPO86376.1 hypothetical protein L8T27_012240 [Niallia sp. Man26]
MKTKAKIIGTKYNTDYIRPRYGVKLETLEGKFLIIDFDYTETPKLKSYTPRSVYYDGKDYGSKLSWYTKAVENMTVQKFLANIADKLDKKYLPTLSK